MLVFSNNTGNHMTEREDRSRVPVKPGPKARARYDLHVDPNMLLKSEAQRQIEEEHGRAITHRQRRFAELYVENQHTITECARLAGFSPNAAREIAKRMLNGRDHPHVVKYIAHLRTERERLYGVTLTGQLERLYRLSRGAEEAKQYSAAINAEKIRSALGGLTVDRRENVNTIDQMTRDQIVARLEELKTKYPDAFTIDGDFQEVTPNARTVTPLLEQDPQGPAPEDAGDED